MFNSKKGHKQNDWTDNEGGVNSQLCYPPNSAASTYSTSKSANIVATRSPYETMMAQITEEYIWNSREYEPALSSTRFKCDDWLIWRHV